MLEVLNASWRNCQCTSANWHYWQLANFWYCSYWDKVREFLGQSKTIVLWFLNHFMRIDSLENLTFSQSLMVQFFLQFLQKIHCLCILGMVRAWVQDGRRRGWHLLKVMLNWTCKYISQYFCFFLFNLGTEMYGFDSSIHFKSFSPQRYLPVTHSGGSSIPSISLTNFSHYFSLSLVELIYYVISLH